jgi:Family of unknown function (DUF5681)
MARKPASNQSKYKVGYGCPPKVFQFKPGQSGNRMGAKRKRPSIAPDLNALMEKAPGTKVKPRQGERERIVTMAEAAIEHLVYQCAHGNRRARRDLKTLARLIQLRGV